MAESEELEIINSVFRKQNCFWGASNNVTELCKESSQMKDSGQTWFPSSKQLVKSQTGQSIFHFCLFSTFLCAITHVERHRFWLSYANKKPVWGRNILYTWPKYFRKSRTTAGIKISLLFSLSPSRRAVVEIKVIWVGIGIQEKVQTAGNTQQFSFEDANSVQP